MNWLALAKRELLDWVEIRLQTFGREVKATNQQYPQNCAQYYVLPAK